MPCLSFDTSNVGFYNFVERRWSQRLEREFSVVNRCGLVAGWRKKKYPETKNVSLRDRGNAWHCVAAAMIIICRGHFRARPSSCWLECLECALWLAFTDHNCDIWLSDWLLTKPSWFTVQKLPMETLTSLELIRVFVRTPLKFLSGFGINVQ